MPPPERLPDIAGMVASYTRDLEGDIDRMAREIQVQEDREFVSALERTGTFVNGAATFEGTLQNTRLDLAAIREAIERQQLRPGRLFLNEDTLQDILSWANEDRDTIPAGVREGLGVSINPRGVRRLAIPEFELHSNPTINIDEVRSRRFNLLDHGQMDPAVQRILEAVVRAKAAPVLQPLRRTPGNPRTVWEALVDLDLVDGHDPSSS
jgi:hypothetical protein